MKPSAERSEAMVGGRNEEIGNGKHEKRGGHRWSRRGRRRQSRKWHIEAGINGITLPTTMHPEMMCVLLSGASLTPSFPLTASCLWEFILSARPTTLDRFIMLCLSPTIK